MQFHGTRRPLDARRRHHGRRPLRERDGGDGQPRGDAAQRRRRRRPGRGVHLRPGPLGRPHAPGQPGLGRRGARRRARRRSAPTTCSSPELGDLGKVAIPQADEQQRLLANLVTQMSADRMPLPRFWYFPRGERAVVVMTGDDHASGGTRRPLRSLPRAQPARLLGRRLGVRARDLVRLPEQRHDRRRRCGLPGAGLRDRAASQHRLRELHDGLAARATGTTSSPISSTRGPAS